MIPSRHLYRVSTWPKPSYKGIENDLGINGLVTGAMIGENISISPQEFIFNILREYWMSLQKLMKLEKVTDNQEGM